MKTNTNSPMLPPLGNSQGGMAVWKRDSNLFEKPGDELSWEL